MITFDININKIEPDGSTEEIASYGNVDLLFLTSIAIKRCIEEHPEVTAFDITIVRR